MIKAILRWLWLLPEREKKAGDITLRGHGSNIYCVGVRK